MLSALAPPEDHYAVLQVSIKASQEDIRSAYDRLTLQYSGNIGGNPQREDELTALKEAFEILNDEDRRYVYDLQRSVSMTKVKVSGPYNLELWKKIDTNAKNLNHQLWQKEDTSINTQGEWYHLPQTPPVAYDTYINNTTNVGSSDVANATQVALSGLLTPTDLPTSTTIAGCGNKPTEALLPQALEKTDEPAQDETRLVHRPTPSTPCPAPRLPAISVAAEDGEVEGTRRVVDSTTSPEDLTFHDYYDLNHDETTLLQTLRERVDQVKDRQETAIKKAQECRKDMDSSSSIKKKAYTPVYDRMRATRDKLGEHKRVQEEVLKKHKARAREVLAAKKKAEKAATELRERKRKADAKQAEREIKAAKKQIEKEEKLKAKQDAQVEKAQAMKRKAEDELHASRRTQKARLAKAAPLYINISDDEDEEYVDT